VTNLFHQNNSLINEGARSLVGIITQTIVACSFSILLFPAIILADQLDDSGIANEVNTVAAIPVPVFCSITLSKQVTSPLELKPTPPLRKPLKW
jgi:hypothetical protein